MRGVCLDAINEAGRASKLSLKNLGGTGHRLVLRPEAEFRPYYDLLKDAEYEVAMVLTGQSMAAGESIAAACTRYADKIDPEVWVIANEWNVDGDASWPPGGDAAFVAVFQEAEPAIRAVRPNAKIYVGGLYSEIGSPPEQPYLDRINNVWGQINADGIDIHPYEDRADDCPRILQAVRDTFHTEVAVFEWNWSTPTDKVTANIATFQGILDAHTEHSCWFCWSDGMLLDHGLKGTKGGAKAVYHAYKQALA